MAAHPNATLLRRAYDAQARGDVEGYLDLLTEDFVLHIPGRSRISGHYAGRDEMRRHLGEISELSGGTFSAEVHDVLGSDDHCIGLIDATAERGGETVNLPRVHVWHVREGKLAELWLTPRDQDAFDAYWGGGEP